MRLDQAAEDPQIGFHNLAVYLYRGSTFRVTKIHCVCGIVEIVVINVKSPDKVVTN